MTLVNGMLRYRQIMPHLTENDLKITFGLFEVVAVLLATILLCLDFHFLTLGKANMGLTSWRGGRVLKRDVATAKNYLDAREIDTLNRITAMFLDQAEFRAQRRQDIRIRDWEASLDKFLRDTELPVLADAGSLSREDAVE